MDYVKIFNQDLNALVNIVTANRLEDGKAFDMRDPETRGKTTEIVDYLFGIRSNYTLALSLELMQRRVLREQYYYVDGVIATHRPDVRLYISKWYETLPNYFVPLTVFESLLTAVDPVTLEVPESNIDGLEYFREDVGLNHFYYFWNLCWPPMLKRSAYSLTEWNRKGEMFLHFHQQLLARYNLERVSRGMQPLTSSNWSEPIPDGFTSGLADTRLNKMADRPPGAQIVELPGWQNVEEKYNRLVEAVKSGILIGEGTEKMNLKELDSVASTSALGDIISNASSSYNPEYYGSLFDSAITLFAEAGEKDKIGGSPIGNPMTALRDPAYYVILSKIVELMQEYKQIHLKPYTTDELSFEGIKITSIEADDVETFFDLFEFDASQGLQRWKHGYANRKWKAKVRRLNHSPITLRMTVVNDHQEPKAAVVRIFLGPKSTDFEAARKMFVELDKFPIQLSSGENVIARNETQFTNIVDDAAHVAYSTSLRYYRCGFPTRLAVPQGTEDGLQLMIYAIVTPHEDAQHHNPEKTGFCGISDHLDAHSLGFPFDRPVTNYHSWLSDNYMTQNITIRHRVKETIE